MLFLYFLCLKVRETPVTFNSLKWLPLNWLIMAKQGVQKFALKWVLKKETNVGCSLVGVLNSIYITMSNMRNIMLRSRLYHYTLI